MKLTSKDLFKPTPEQVEQMERFAAEHGIDPAVRDDTNMYRLIGKGDKTSSRKKAPSRTARRSKSRRSKAHAA